MIRLLIVEFWPVVLPSIVYLIIILYRRNKAGKLDEDIPRFTQGPWFWTVIATFAVAIVCFVLLGMSHEPFEGVYDPAHMQDGKLVTGTMTRDH